MMQAGMSTAGNVRETAVVEAEEKGGVSDEALAERFFSTRDQEAFSELVRRYQDSAYRVAWARCGHREMAEDAVQDAFMELARKRMGAPLKAFKPWFLSVVANMTRHRMRTEQRIGRRERLACKAEEARGAAAGRGGDSQGDLDPETQSALGEALGKLHEDLRLPLVLYFVEGMTQDEIGATVGLSQPLIARRIAQGLDKLRARLSMSGIAVGAAALPGMLKQAEYLRAPADLATKLSSDAFLNVAMAGGRESMRLIAASAGWGKAAVAVAVLAAASVTGVLVFQRNAGGPGESQTALTPASPAASAKRRWNWDLTRHPPPKGLFHGPQLTWEEGKGLHTTVKQMASMVLPPLHYRIPLRATVIMHPDEAIPIRTGLDLAVGNDFILSKVYMLSSVKAGNLNQDFKVVTYICDDYLVHLADGEKVQVVLKYEGAERFTRMVLTVSNLSVKQIVLEEIHREEIPAYVFAGIAEAEKLKPSMQRKDMHVLESLDGKPPPKELVDMLNAPFSEEPAP